MRKKNILFANQDSWIRLRQDFGKTRQLAKPKLRERRLVAAALRGPRNDAESAVASGAEQSKIFNIFTLLRYIAFFLTLHGYLFAVSASPDDLSDSNQLNSVKQSIEAIKRDDSNISYTSMMDQVVMPQHSLSNHDDGAFFYTDNRLLLSDIISMVVERPQGIIKKSDGTVGIYRDFDFKKDLASLFVKERRVAGGYDGYHLGATPRGPTNRVVVVLRANDASKIGTAQFIEAYPQSIGN